VRGTHGAAVAVRRKGRRLSTGLGLAGTLGVGTISGDLALNSPATFWMCWVGLDIPAVGSEELS
jgi:hypothetical protein